MVMVVVPIVLLSLPFPVTRSMKTSCLTAFSPVIKGVAYLKTNISKPFSYIAQLKNALEENSRLKDENERLKRQLPEYDEVKAENERLIRLLNFVKESKGVSKPARVIGWDLIEWHHTVLIDKGKKHGVEENMPVVSGDGVVGKILEAGDSVSKVLLVIDNNSRIGALVQRSREAGIIEGRQRGQCRMNYLSREAEIKVGDRIVTSGTGGTFPKGLFIGFVTKLYFEKFGLHKSADVKPAVDFGKLEEVLVLITQKTKK